MVYFEDVQSSPNAKLIVGDLDFNCFPMIYILQVISTNMHMSHILIFGNKCYILLTHISIFIRMQY